MATLEFTVGTARSGKDTRVKEIVDQRHMLAPNNHYVIVSGDQIRLALYGCRYSSYGESFVFATMQVMTRTLLSSGYNVIINDTNTTKESCRRILEIAPTAQPIFVLTCPEVCIERAKATNQEDLIPVIEAQWRQLHDIYASKAGSVNIEEAYNYMMLDIKYEIFDRWGTFTVPRLVKEA